MSTADLVSYLQSLEVSLWLEGDELRWRIPEGAAAPALETVVACRQDDIAALLGRGPGTTRDHRRPILPVVREGELPLSFAQQRVWFAAQWDPANPSFNIPSAVRLTGVLDVGAVEQSVNGIIERHEVLRTSFVEVDGRPVQRAAPALVLSVPVVDMSVLPGTERQAEARRLMAAEARWSFDLARGPLVRATLLRLDEEEHLLLLTMHHIVSDAWSTEVFARELGELYRGAVTGEPVSLPRLPAQYADYAVWQREWLQGEELDRQRSYWMERLSDAPRVLELPADRPRPPVQSFRGARERFLLSEDLSDRLKALSQEAGTTLFMTLLAAFKVLLYRYTAQADILVGSPIANRNRAEVEGLIGLFVNTVVLRTDLSGNPSFRELLGRVRRTTLEAVASQDLPFEMLLDELQVTRELSRTPLVQVMMVLSSASRQHSVEAGPSLSVLEIESTTAPFDLTLSMTETVRGLQGAVEYATDLFDAATIVCLAEHLKVVLEKLVADPDQGIADVPILSGAEQHRLLVEWNRTGKGSLHQAGAHELLELKVEQRPDAVAVVCKGQQLTYGELNRRANLLAGHLIELGVGAEDLVGIMMERSAEMIVSQLAVLKAGGAFVPLEPSLPEERLTYMIKDTAAAVILTTAALLEAVPQTEARITCVDEVGCENDACSTTNPGRCTRPEQLAYVIYTSGSTGRPKGVMCRHGGLMNLVEWHSEAYSVCGLDRATQIASAGFDASICEIWPYITAGATLCIVDDEVRKAPDDLLRYVLDQEITVSFMPTQLAEAFLQTAAGTRLPLRCLLAAGDRLSIYADPGWGFALFNNYGPTENTVASTVARVVPAPGHGGGPPIGKPIQGVQAYVLDDRLCPVPVGVPGELCVGGDSLARGYLSRPELTAEAFIPNPFSDEPGSRLYRTGDLVRYLPDGSIEFLGRIDHQVKIRGYRIELGEVEAALSHHPGLAKVVVLARDGDGGDRRLVAYLIPSEGKDSTVGELRGFLLDRLPEYMVPSAFVRLEALPLTPAGKVDQRALPAPDGSRPELDSELVAPRTPTEEVLAGIWAQVLGIEHVGVYDGFFQLGGHSLLATQVVTRVRQAFKVEIPFRAFFDAPTVAEMAEHIDALSLLESDQQAPSEDADFMEWEL